MGEIISLRSKLLTAKARRDWQPYKTAVEGMDKIALLEDMVAYTDLRTNSEESTLDCIFKGMIIFEKIAQIADTEELKDTARFYNGLLEMELREYEALLDGQESNHILSDTVLCKSPGGDKEDS